uniref:Elongation factor-like 1 n=1 Tax=Aceria tosichella TaxID=561515 RepID=A0A6G1SAJ1_9ACAR
MKQASTSAKKVQIRSHGKSESDGDTNSNDKHVYDWASAIDDIDDDKYYFMPEKNNVIFASAIDDWAFTIGAFAKILSERHKINLAALERSLWGDFYIDVKQKRILPNAQAKAKKTLFVSMVLENIWKIYDIVAVRRDKIRMAKICDTLGVQLSQRDINHTDARYQTKLILSKWLQLSKHVLDCVKNIVPSPNNLSAKRVERLLSSNIKRFQQLPPETQRLKDSFLKCSPDESAIKIACVSKMIPIERENLPENRKNLVRLPSAKPKHSDSSTDGFSSDKAKNSNLDKEEETAKNEIVFIAFARIFSGVLRKGDKLYVLGPRHDPSLVDAETIKSIDESKKLEDLSLSEHVTVATVENFYLLMGRDIERIDCALAGNIVGIQGLERHLIRTATLSSDLYCPPFNDLHLPAAPILRVAIEPKNPLDTPVLMNGLKLLNQADPCVEVKLQKTGEHVIVATGEVHLQHCLKDLQERYANDIELNISQPIVPFRETIVLPPKTDMVNETIDDINTIFENRKRTNKDGIIEITTPNKKCRIRMRASPIPQEISDILTSSGSEVLRIISKLVTSRHKLDPQSFGQLSESNKKRLETFKKDLCEQFDKCRKEKADWKNIYPENVVGRIWSFGPKYSGPNILIAGQDVAIDYNLWNRITNQDKNGGKVQQNDLADYVDSFISGFQLATQSGPLCEEPMMGVCFTILEWTYQDELSAGHVNSKSLEGQNGVETSHADVNEDDNGADDDKSVASSQCQQRDSYGPMSGQIISTVKDGCRRAFQAQPQRLMSPMFSCDIQVNTDVLGKMYAVMARRHGRILHGDMREGSQTFEIQAFIPVIESLDFVNEIRKQTSGMANPQLIFSHYEIIDVDPFWTPSTEEEYALYGEKADTENRARKYMNLVRRRKGLAVQEKIVEHGEKQRTIKRNK